MSIEIPNEQARGESGMGISQKDALKELKKNPIVFWIKPDSGIIINHYKLLQFSGVEK